MWVCVCLRCVLNSFLYICFRRRATIESLQRWKPCNLSFLSVCVCVFVDKTICSYFYEIYAAKINILHYKIFVHMYRNVQAMWSSDTKLMTGKPNPKLLRYLWDCYYYLDRVSVEILLIIVWNSDDVALNFFDALFACVTLSFIYERRK